jgi:hypothetical protein
MFALSWSAVDPLYYGLNCNSLSKKCDSSNILGSGRYFIGFTNYLIPFPSNYQTIEFSTKNSANGKYSYLSHYIIIWYSTIYLNYIWFPKKNFWWILNQ